jgi:hypothetical protein
MGYYLFLGIIRSMEEIIMQNLVLLQAKKAGIDGNYESKKHWPDPPAS